MYRLHLPAGYTYKDTGRVLTIHRDGLLVRRIDTGDNLNLHIVQD